MPFLKLQTQTPSATSDSSDDIERVKKILNDLKADRLTDIEAKENIELLHCVVKNFNGRIWTINLRDSTTSISNSSDAMSARYFLLKPIFFGQLVFIAGKNKDHWRNRGDVLATLLNKMLEIHLDSPGEFVGFPEKGRMFHVIKKPTSGAGSFLLKADPRFNLPVGNGDAARDFICKLYNDHFLFQYLSEETVIVMQFPNPEARQQAIKQISEQLKVDRSTPTHPVRIEKIFQEGTSTNKASKLTVEVNNRHYLISSSITGILNFSQTYTLAEINRFTFSISSSAVERFLPMPTISGADGNWNQNTAVSLSRPPANGSVVRRDPVTVPIRVPAVAHASPSVGVTGRPFSGIFYNAFAHNFLETGNSSDLDTEESQIGLLDRSNGMRRF